MSIGKTLSYQEAHKLLERTSNFYECEITSITFKDTQTLSMTLNAQDKSRDYDWIGLEFECFDVSDAKLVDDNELSYIDLHEGISILFDEAKIYFGVGQYNSTSHLKESILFVEAKTIKFQEVAFQN